MPERDGEVLFAELRADVSAAQGDPTAARALYERAISDIVESGGNAAYLEMKRDALSADAPVANSGKP